MPANSGTGVIILVRSSFGHLNDFNQLVVRWEDPNITSAEALGLLHEIPQNQGIFRPSPKLLSFLNDVLWEHPPGMSPIGDKAVNVLDQWVNKIVQKGIPRGTDPFFTKEAVRFFIDLLSTDPNWLRRVGWRKDELYQHLADLLDLAMKEIYVAELGTYESRDANQKALARKIGKVFSLLGLYDALVHYGLFEAFPFVVRLCTGKYHAPQYR